MHKLNQKMSIAADLVTVNSNVRLSALLPVLFVFLYQSVLAGWCSDYVKFEQI